MGILLIGTMGSGKDSAADYIVEAYGFERAKLGKYVRKHVDEMFPNLTEAARRSMYQKYGEGMRALFGENHWNEVLDASIEDHENIIIADGRQPHEIDYWSKRGYQLVAIDIPIEERRRRLSLRDGDDFKEENFSHPTEEKALHFVNQIRSGKLDGYYIDNSKSLEQTTEQIDSIMKEIGYTK